MWIVKKTVVVVVIGEGLLRWFMLVVLLSNVWQAVIWINGYYICKEKNARVFGSKVSSTNKSFQDIQLKSYEWITVRSNKHKEIDWQRWLWDPTKSRRQ